MKFNSQIVANGSGSIGGCCFSHNRSGAYIRRKAMPVYPGTIPQVAVSNAMAALITAWRTLSDANKDGWRSYALTYPKTDSLGATHYTTGQACFVGCNIPRVQLGLAQITTPPALGGASNLTPPGITSLTASTKVLIVTYTNSDVWATQAGGYLMVYTSRPKGKGVNYYRGPYQFAGKVIGAVTPPTSPANITTPFTLAALQQVFVRFRAMNADGRLSNVSHASVFAV